MIQDEQDFFEFKNPVNLEKSCKSCLNFKPRSRLTVTEMDVLERIGEQVKNNPVVLYMKGTPQFPQCGFSMRAAQALQQCEMPFTYVNVLQDPEILEHLPRFADWPTFPQLFINGELVGGCDITLELHATGELKPMLEQAVAKAAT